jgi:hypothetical protein
MHERRAVFESEGLVSNARHIAPGQFGKDSFDQSGILIGAFRLSSVTNYAGFRHGIARMLLLRAS